MSSVPEDMYETPVSKLGLSPRTINSLIRANVTKVGDVLELSDEDLLKIRNFNYNTLEELRKVLDDIGL
jgi:DNA-directed RNA polymerase subunit alpha